MTVRVFRRIDADSNFAWMMWNSRSVTRPGIINYGQVVLQVKFALPVDP